MPPPTHMVTMPYRALPRFHLLEECSGEFGAGAAEGMAESDGASIDIDARRVETKGADDGERPARRRLRSIR